MKRNHSNSLFLFASFVVIVGLLLSRFLITAGMGLLFVSVFLQKDAKTHIKGIMNNKVFLSMSGIFVLYLISGLWSENISYFIDRLNIKLPFLILPFAFLANKQLSSRNILIILYFFGIATTLSVLWSLGMFFSDYAYYIEIYSMGQILPTPIQHIRFSIMVVISVVIFYHLSTQNFYLLDSKEKHLQLSIALILIIYLHILAVRSGLLCLYIVALYFVVSYIIKTNKYRIGLTAVAIMVISMLIAYKTIPTIKNKVDYTRYSISLFQKNENIRDLSDSRRLGSIVAGINIYKDHPFLGCGIGDIKDETNDFLAQHYEGIKNLDLLPHNQYIFVAAALGTLGLSVFLLFTLLPIFINYGFFDPLVGAFHLLFFASFMVEHTLEAQIGTALYLFVLLLSLKNHNILSSQNE